MKPKNLLKITEEKLRIAERIKANLIKHKSIDEAIKDIDLTIWTAQYEIKRINEKEVFTATVQQIEAKPNTDGVFVINAPIRQGKIRLYNENGKLFVKFKPRKK